MPEAEGSARPDHAREPIVEAALAYHERDSITFLIPGHKQGRGLDERTRRELGGDMYRFDMASQSGLDDRLARNGVDDPGPGAGS